jgi:hypothetical protein
MISHRGAWRGGVRGGAGVGRVEFRVSSRISTVCGLCAWMRAADAVSIDGAVAGTQRLNSVLGRSNSDSGGSSLYTAAGPRQPGLAYLTGVRCCCSANLAFNQGIVPPAEQRQCQCPRPPAHGRHQPSAPPPPARGPPFRRQSTLRLRRQRRRYLRSRYHEGSRLPSC